jgi:hypothetical protein
MKASSCSNGVRSAESRELRLFRPHDLPSDLIAVHIPIIARYLSGETPPVLD